MTRTMHKVFFISTCVICIGFCILMYIGIHAIIHSSTLIYTTDSLFSDAYVTSLQQTLHKLIQQEGPTYAMQQIQKVYPVIAAATCAYIPPKKAHITIESHAPLVLLNKDYVLIDQGIVVSKDIFNPAILKEIPNLFINQQVIQKNNSFPKSLYTLLTNLSLLCDQYIVTWFDDHALVLQDKTQNDVVFVCDTNGVPDQATLDVCHQVAQECRVTPSRKHHLVIDARFKDQLIVYGDTRGYGHGSDVG